MKKNRLFLALLAFACTSFFACSSNDDETTAPGVGAETGSDIGDAAGSRFMSVQIINPAGTKATDGGYAEGSADENQVNNLRFYFFDEAGNPVTVNATSGVNKNQNYVIATSIEPAGKDMDNVEKIIKATVVINTKEGDNIKVKKVVAVANYDVAELDDNEKSLSDLCKIVGDYSKISRTVDGGTTKNDNFLMTSSSYDNADRQVTIAADILPSNLCNSKEAAEANPVNIYIERVVAKVKMDISWTNGAVETETVTLNGESVEAVKVKEKLSETEKKDVTVTIDGTEKPLYVIFTKWDVTGTAPESYLIKKIGSTTDWGGLFTGWNNTGWFRSYWAQNTEGVTNMTLKHFDYQSIGQKFNEGYVYCLENAGDADAADGTKSVYDPKNTITNRTQAIIAATLVTLDDSKNATPVSVVNWAGKYYTEVEATETMLDLITSPVYTDATHTTKITTSDVQLVTATTAKVADALSETSPRYYSYLQLTSDAAKKTFYDANGNVIDETKVNDILKSLPGAKVWRNGLTYYYTDIEHLGSEATKGLYGVVRNHVYDIAIKSVVGLGTPVLDPTETIIPQKPENVDTYIAAQINILSWRIVKQSVDLEW